MGKADPVSQNRIQTEFIEKELKATKLRTDFTLNVRRMANDVVSEKVTSSPRPNRLQAGEPTTGTAALAKAGRSIAAASTDAGSEYGEASSTVHSAARGPMTLPRLDEEDVAEAQREAKMMADLVDEIMKPKRTPRQIYPEPQTTTMRIGWDLDKMREFRTGMQGTRWRRPKVSTELSIYCRSYCQMYGYGPYAQPTAP